MYSLTEAELSDLLQKNPALSIAGGTRPISTETLIQAGSHRQSEIQENKYRNHPVYILQDGYVLDSSLANIERKQRIELLDKAIQRHGKICDVFDSHKEYKRFQYLQLLERGGQISGLIRQYSLVIQEAFEYQNEHVRAITYNADFFYQTDEKIVVEDVKGFDRRRQKWLTTQVFDLKWKLLKAKYPQYSFVLF